MQVHKTFIGGGGGNFVPIAAGSPDVPEVWLGNEVQKALVNPKDANTIYITKDGGVAGVVNMWRTGAGVPNNTVGSDGDLYLNTITDEYYQRENGIYVLKGDLTGADGADGADGSGGFIANAWLPVWKVNGLTMSGGSGSTGWLAGNIFNFTAYKVLNDVANGLVTVEGLPFPSLMRSIVHTEVDGFSQAVDSFHGLVNDAESIINLRTSIGGQSANASGSFTNGILIVTGSIPLNIA
ncbi:hypothetical protein [Flagellimonas sp. CMM7]|uniref:hypothetical protein n=1 Tax=Flagellimonas sp. CMM7 TaxID=2654676 RepID=UPI0013D7F518|nr:hypothetical protein [Flagellimonas sp. CMM7]UII79572.1 hypothetical protein LV704_18165 [Flagellimonas sp. CMM7]